MVVDYLCTKQKEIYVRKYLIILVILFAGCGVNKQLAPDDIVQREGILLEVKSMESENSYAAYMWIILGDEGDTIYRYLFKVPLLEPGIRVPYFDYKQ